MSHRSSQHLRCSVLQCEEKSGAVAEVCPGLKSSEGNQNNEHHSLKSQLSDERLTAAFAQDEAAVCLPNAAGTSMQSNPTKIIQGWCTASADKSLPFEKRSEPGGFDVPFVHPLDTKHICPVCLLALRQPVQTKCGHRMCRSCMIGNSEGHDQRCPVDGKVLTEVFPDNFCRREILDLLVMCTNHKQKCSWQGRLRELEDHLSVCEWQMQTCPNGDCGERMPRHQIGSHIDNCPFQLQSCDFCGEKIAASYIKEHCRDSCQEMLKECPHLCGSFVQRKELNRHVREQCPETIVDCRFCDSGCPFQGKRQAVNEHCKQSQERHLELVATALVEQERERRQLESLLRENERRIQQIGDHVPKMEEQLHSRALEVDSRMNSLQKQVEAVQNVGSHPGIDRHSVALLQPRTTLLEHNVAALNRQLRDIQAEQRKICEESARMVGILDDHDLRLLAVESVSHDGCLLWKLPNFDRLVADARNGVKVSHYSPPFYSNRYGYKACARVYPFGDGSGKASHLSLFFVVMRGNHDALLPWPFSQRVTLAVLDQSPSRQHLEETFQPDVRSSSYQRPTTGMNIASGCPRMVSHDLLFSARYSYIKDNTLFLKIKIDTSGLVAL